MMDKGEGGFDTLMRPSTAQTTTQPSSDGNVCHGSMDWVLTNKPRCLRTF